MNYTAETRARAAESRGQRNLDALEDDREERDAAAAARAQAHANAAEDRAFWLRMGGVA